eukprot:symbB.v1.2.002874.t1/scaffold155.1/size293413/9
MSREVCDLESYNALLASLTAAQQWDKAISIFNEVQFGGDATLQADKATYSHALVACSAVGCWEVALEILAATQQREIQLSNGDLKNALSSCCKGRRWQESLELLQTLKKRGAASMLQYTSVISALGDSKQSIRAHQVYKEMQQELGLPQEDDAAQLDRLQKRLLKEVEDENWTGVSQLLQQFRQESLDLGTCAAAVAKACEKKQQWQEALHLSDYPEVLASIARTCAQSRQWAHALEILDKMKAKDVQATLKMAESCVEFFQVWKEESFPKKSPPFPSAKQPGFP